MINSGFDNLPEYSGNPFIARLPQVMSRSQILSRLRNLPIFDEKERNFPAHLRKHCVLRLSNYFEPIDRHIQFCEKFDMLLRQGYISRNPLTGDYMQRLQNSHERKKLRVSGNQKLEVFESFASSFALIGASGVGKSRTVCRVLSYYDQIIEHKEPFLLSQIVWIRLDCPSQGSQIQLCRNFFYAIDRLLGTSYQAKYAGKRHALDDMLLSMGHIANLHAIGALIIDEIQFLKNIKNGSEALLRFFVTLVNTIGIPIILVGTNSALPLLQDNFKEARRANGLGSMIWSPIENNKTWRHFVNELWKYQWVADFIPITDEIADVLHEESQGIVDILIKLFTLVQMRLISVREASPGKEIITASLIRKVAKEDFLLVRPMLDALKHRDMKALNKYDDLLPFQSHFEKILHDYNNTTTVISYIPPTPIPLLDKQDDVDQQLMISLKGAGYAEDVIQLMIDNAKLRIPSGDFLLLMSEIIKELQFKNVKEKTTRAARRKVIEIPTTDLRYLANNGISTSAYVNLLASGIMRIPGQDIPA